MAVTVGELLVKIGADTAELKTGFAKAEQSLKGFEKTAKALGTILGGGYLAAQAKKMGEALVGAASAAESEMARVEATVKAAGASWDELGPKIEAYSQSVIRLGFDDEQTATSVAKLLNVTQDYGAALDLNKTAMDLARYKGVELDAATTALTRAWAGNTRMLKEFGIEVEAGASKLEILGAINDKVRGQSEAFANTAVGKMEALNIRWANLQEIIGARLLPVMDKLVSIASRAMDWFARLSPETQNLIGGLTGLAVAVGVAVPAIIALNAAAGALQISLGSLALGLGAAAAIGALVVGVSELMNAENRAADAASRLIEAQDKETKQAGKLLEQYDQLSGKAKLTADERQRMHDLANQIADQIPDAVKGYDKEHNAIIDLGKAYAELNKQLAELNKKRQDERNNQLAIIDRQIRDEKAVPDIIRRAAAERAKSIQGQMLSPEARDAALRANTAALEKGLRASNERLKKLMEERRGILNPEGVGGNSGSGQPSGQAKDAASINKTMEESLAKAQTMERILGSAFNLNEEKVSIFTKALKDLVEAGLTETDALVQNVLRRLNTVQSALEAQKAGLEGNGLPDEAARAAMASGNLSYLLSEQERKRKEADAKAVESQIAVGAALTEAYQDQVIAFELAEDDKQRRQDQKDVEALERQLAVAREQQRIIEQAAVDQEYRIAEKYRRMSEFYEKDAIAFKLAEDEKQRQADAKIVEETDAFTAAWKARQEQIDTAKRVEEGLANEALEKQMARWKAIQAMYDDIAAKEQEFQARFQATISGALSSLTSATGGVQGAFRSLLESFRSYAVQMATQAIMKIKAVEGAIKVIEAAVAGNPVLALLMLGGALLLGRGRSSSDNNAFEEQQAKWEESVSRISSTLRSAFSARTYGEYLKTFGDRLKETVVENLSKAFMESAAMKPMMERLTAMIQQATSDGVLSGGETDAIRLLYQQIAQMGGAFWKQLQGINFSAPTGGGGVVRTASTVVNNNYFTVQSVEPTLEGANRFVKQYVRPALNDLAASAV